VDPVIAVEWQGYGGRQGSVQVSSPDEAEEVFRRSIVIPR